MGDLVTFLARVNHVGRTSMEIGIRVEAQNIRQRSVRHTNSCYFTMVAMDNGRPAPVPPLALETDLQRCRFEAAEQRVEGAALDGPEAGIREPPGDLVAVGGSVGEEQHHADSPHAAKPLARPRDVSFHI